LPIARLFTSKHRVYCAAEALRHLQCRRFNTIAGAVSILPALTSAVPVVFVFGIAFGAVLLSAVASTTVLVQHNLPARSLVVRDQRVHRGVRVRPNPRPDPGGMDLRWSDGARIDHISGCAVHRHSATAKRTGPDELMPAAIVTNTSPGNG
jgi:hypothetical protein